MAAADGSEPAEREPLPALVRRELAWLARSDGVIDGTCEFGLAPDGAAAIRFEFETETLVVPRDSGILEREPILFIYRGIESVGVEAPLVLSERPDFPRTFPHLNPVRPSSPASLCLARAGLQAIYDRYGIEGVMQRLRSWMRAAQTGALTADGWHPVPLSGQLAWRPAIFDAARLQEMATTASAGTSSLTGVACVIPGTHHIEITDQVEPADTPAHLSALSRAVEGVTLGDAKVGIPWLFVWPAERRPVEDPVFGFWQTYKDLREGLAAVGLTQALETGIGSILANGCHCKRDGHKQLVAIVGIWRPVALGQEIFGLSADPVARTLELKAFVLQTAVTKELLEDATSLEVLVANPRPGPDLSRWVSGLPALRPAALLGYGALGCELGEHLVRGGAEHLEVFETDGLAPHNLARHRGDRQDVYVAKATIFERRARRINTVPLERLKGTQKDLLTLSDEGFLAALGRAEVVIDATVNERMKARLSQLGGRIGRPVIRAELRHRGRLGLTMVTAGAGNPDLLDLHAMVCHQAIYDAAVEAWLIDEHLRGPGDAELILGFGCASLTTKLPGFVVAHHAAAMMPTIMAALESDAPPGFGINRLSEKGHARGSSWVDVPPFIELVPATAPDWRVRIHPAVVRFLADERANKLPAETGGYLYGRWDLAQRRMTIVTASSEPPGSVASPDGIELGPAGNTAFERALATLTRGTVALCGSWHSHPTEAGTDLSGKDLATLTRFREVDAPQALPTLFVVTSGDAVAAHLIV